MMPPELVITGSQSLPVEVYLPAKHHNPWLACRERAGQDGGAVAFPRSYRTCGRRGSGEGSGFKLEPRTPSRDASTGREGLKKK